MMILYSTHCPVCMGVEKMLNNKKIEHKIIDDEDKIRELGFNSSPILEFDGKFYVGKDIFTVINKQSK